MKGDWSDQFVHHWKYYTGHARASKKDLETIKSKIKSVGKYCKVLILGATPEYRNLCGELKVQVTCLDFSKYNFEYLKQEVATKPQERLVEGNWLQTILDEKFDIILGDVVLNLVGKKGVPILLENVGKMLKPNGLFLPRLYMRGEEEKIAGEDAVKKYRKHGSKKPIYNHLVRDLYLAAYNFNKDTVLLKDIYSLASNLYKQKLLSDEELSLFDKLGMKDRLFSFYMPTKQVIEEEIKEYFQIVDVFYGAEDDNPELYPLYILKKK